ncbi:hypothetical protein WG66_005987 [Moniliophthora roreri]|nr:hypothetical protein WG66_005987 [Moniliophthora roreri]
MGYMVADAHLGAQHTHSHTGKPASTQRVCDERDSLNVVPHVASLMVHGRPNASINSIPIELLTDIFEFCQPQNDWTDPLIPTLENIVVVCSRWRTAALAAPYLWSKITLCNPRPIHVPIIRRYLERSKSCPLDVMIDQSADPEDCRLRLEWEGMVKGTNAILSLVSQHMHRLQSLELSIRCPVLFPRPPLATPLLKLVEIRGSKISFHDPQSFWQLILASPAIRSVSWSSAVDQVFLPHTEEWAKLTHLTGSFAVDDCFLDVLSKCTPLEVLDIRNRNDCNMSPAAPRAPFILPSLRVLGFNTLESSLRNHLILPKLQEIEILRVNESLRPWLDFFNRSACSLRRISFEFDSFTDSDEDLDAFLSLGSISTVIDLTVSVVGSSNDMVKKLTMRADNVVLPLLERMTLSLHNCEDGLLQAMVASRVSPLTSLRSIDITHTLVSGYCNPLDFASQSSADAQFLKQMQLSGFGVTYSGP